MRTQGLKVQGTSEQRQKQAAVGATVACDVVIGLPRWRGVVRVVSILCCDVTGCDWGLRLGARFARSTGGEDERGGLWQPYEAEAVGCWMRDGLSLR